MTSETVRASAARWFHGVQESYRRLTDRPTVAPVMSHCWTPAADRANFKVGDAVEVYKGRKCPLGTYEVALIGQNDYGAYVHLRDARGTWHRYVNVSNLRRPRPTTAQLEAAAGTARRGTEFHRIVTGVLALGNHADGWLALCDHLGGQGRDAEAAALRALVRDHYRLECVA